MPPGGSLKCRNERRPLPAGKNCWLKSPQGRPSWGSVTFEVIEWFQARVADVKGFAGSRTKLTHEPGVRRTAARTRNDARRLAFGVWRLALGVRACARARRRPLTEKTC